MSARRRLGWAVAIVVGAAFIGTITTYQIATNTEWGRRKFIKWALNSVNGTLGGRGTLTVGVLQQIGRNGIYATDVSLLDTAGVVVVHVNELRGMLEYSALFNKSIHIQSVNARGVQLNLKRDFTGPWNIAYIINGGPKSVGPHLPSVGDDILIDAIALTDAAISMQYPWSPNKMFVGRVRDSVIAVRKSVHDLAFVPQGILERRHIALPRVVGHTLWVATPGADPSSIQIDSLGGTISDPAVRIMQTAGSVKWTPDSLMLDLPTVALPASSGTAKGSVSWYRPGAVRYDVMVNAQAGLSDLGWIWDVLPESGSGSAQVRLRTLANADDAEYTLSKLDVSAMNSHVTGDISVVSRPASLVLQGVDLTFAPLRSELLRRLSYDGIPEEIKGTFRGRLVAKRGGPLTAFNVDRIDAHFDDDKVPGAVSSFVANGLVGFGARPTARNVSVRDANIDLRSVRVVVPTVPPVDGTLRGTLFVASADLDQADIPSLNLLWTDGAGNVSHISGRAQTRYSGRVPTVNTELTLDPLALKAIVRVDTTFLLGATLRGTVSANGAVDSLQWKALLADGTNKLRANGIAGLRDSVWTIRAESEVEGINLQTLLTRADMPATALNGPVQFSFAAQMRPDSTVHVAQAEFTANVKQAAADGRPEFAVQGSGGLDTKRLHIDSATVTMGGILMDLHGALARDSAATDTLLASIQADSLGAARPELIRLADMLMPVDSVLANSLRSYAADTLDGDLSGSAVMVGSLPAFAANVSLSARNARVGFLNARRVFGSVRATGLPDHAHFDATATIDDISGVGAVKLSTAEIRVLDASTGSGALRLDVIARDTTALRVRGAFTRANGVLAVRMDSLRFNYSEAIWASATPALITSDSLGLRMDSLLVRSNHGGVLALTGDIPKLGPVSARLHVDRFPAGEAATFATASATRFRGLLAGDAQLAGTRLSPLITWKMIADSVGTDVATSPPIATDGAYDNQKLVAHAVLVDSVKSRLRLEARVPLDLSLQKVAKRLLSTNVDAEIDADSLRLEGLPLHIRGVSSLQGVLVGRLALGGPMDRPFATGRLVLDNFGASVDILGIKPSDGRVVLVAEQDELKVEQFRFRSGLRVTDTVGVTGVLKFPAGKAATVDVHVAANNASLANQSDGTLLNLSGTLNAKGPLKRPAVVASLFIPRANFVADPLGARTALDLSSAEARELLGETEVPVAGTTMDPVARLGQYMTVSQASVQMGEEVWVRTPESSIKLGGALDIKTGASGLLVLDGEVTANRGIFRLDLGVVRRSFDVDSGSIRFFGNDDVPATVNVSATHVVRASTGEETPIHVAITGTLQKLNLALSTDDEVFSGAPDSEVISLLIFGAPTFGLNNQSQNTVKAVTGILVPSVGGLGFDNTLQRLLPYFNTIQLNAAGGQDDLSSTGGLGSLLNNLNIAAGKQWGERTFLRLNTGLCRGSASTDVRFNLGLAAEYRFTRTLIGQIGVDQGASPCTQLGNGSGLSRYQFGFDLFRQWVF